MSKPFALVLEVNTDIVNRHRVLELSYGAGSVFLYALASESPGCVPAAFLGADDPGETMAFLFALAKELDVAPPAPDRSPRTTPGEVGFVFDGNHRDDDGHEWLACKLRLSPAAEAYLRICPTRGVAYLEERAPGDAADFFARLCNAILEPLSPADWSTERPAVPSLDWLVDDIPLAYDVVPEPVPVRPPHVRWIGPNLVAVSAESRRLMLIRPQIQRLFEADYIFSIRGIDDSRVLVHHRTNDRESHTLVTVPDGATERISGPIPPRPGWKTDVRVDETPAGLRVRSRDAQVTFQGVRGMWRAVSPRYVVTRLDAYYLLDGVECQGWVIAPSSRWAAFELDDGATQLAFATFGGRLFTAKLDERHIDGRLPRTSRSVAKESFWQGIDADYVTVGGVHTDLSVTRLAREFALDRDMLAARLEARLGQFLACYLPRDWRPKAVAQARFDLAPAWARALERGVELDTVQAAAERLAVEVIRRRLFDGAFVNLLVRGGRPLEPEDLSEFVHCVDQASEAFLAPSTMCEPDEELSAEVALHLRRASDSLRFLADESVEVEPDSWATIRWRLDRIGQLAQMKAPPLVGKTELLHLARDVEALA